MNKPSLPLVKCDICGTSENIIEKSFIVDKEPQYRQFRLCPLCYVTILERTIVPLYLHSQDDAIELDRWLVDGIECLT